MEFGSNNVNVVVLLKPTDGDTKATFFKGVC